MKTTTEGDKEQAWTSEFTTVSKKEKLSQAPRQMNPSISTLYYSAAASTWADSTDFCCQRSLHGALSICFGVNKEKKSSAFLVSSNFSYFVICFCAPNALKDLRCKESIKAVTFYDWVLLILFDKMIVWKQKNGCQHFGVGLLNNQEIVFIFKRLPKAPFKNIYD